MAKMGRPLKEIDKKQFEYLCSIQCTEEEIAGMYDCSIDTVNNWCKRIYNETFSDAFKRFSAPGKISIRRNQFKLGEKSVPMAIWLGKQYLGQAEKVETQQTISDDGFIEALEKKVDNSDWNEAG